MADERPLSPEDQNQLEMFRQTLAPEVPPEAPSIPPASGGQPPATEVPAPAPGAPTEVPPEQVPSWRLREESEARRAAEGRAAALEQRLGEVDRYLQQQRAQQAPTKTPDFFENPDMAVRNVIAQVMIPYLQEGQRVSMANAQLIAYAVHGQEEVSKAEQAFLEAVNAQSLDPMEYEQVVQSPNRFDAAVKWYKKQSVLSSVGSNPEEWFQKRLDAAMADPAFQTKVLEKIRASASTRPGEVRLPPSLTRVPGSSGGGGEVTGDLSDRSLFDFARPGR